MCEFSKLSEEREGLLGIVNKSRAVSLRVLRDDLRYRGGSYICKARACALRTREALARARICDHVGCSRGYINARPRHTRDSSCDPAKTFKRSICSPLESIEPSLSTIAVSRLRLFALIFFERSI